MVDDVVVVVGRGDGDGVVAKLCLEISRSLKDRSGICGCRFSTCPQKCFDGRPREKVGGWFQSWGDRKGEGL